jgi:hypothetical protein
MTNIDVKQNLEFTATTTGRGLFGLLQPMELFAGATFTGG